MIHIGANESNPYFLRLDGVNFSDLPYYTPMGATSNEEATTSGSFKSQQEAEHLHAQSVMNDLDADLNFALRLQEEEEQVEKGRVNREGEDERMARELQGLFDREEREHEEYLRKSGVDLEERRRRQSGGVGGGGEGVGTEDLLSFDDEGTGNVAPPPAPRAELTVAVFDDTPFDDGAFNFGEGNGQGGFDRFEDEGGRGVGEGDLLSAVNGEGGGKITIEASIQPTTRDRKSSKGKMPPGMRPPSGMKPPPEIGGTGGGWGDKRGNLEALNGIEFQMDIGEKEGEEGGRGKGGGSKRRPYKTTA